MAIIRKLHSPALLELQAASLAIGTPRTDARALDTLHSAIARSTVRAAEYVARHIEAAPLGLAMRHNARSAR